MAVAQGRLYPVGVGSGRDEELEITLHSSVARSARGAEAPLVERVRSALIECALAAYEDAAQRGLCSEGAWEAAVGAMRSLNLHHVTSSSHPPDEGEG